MQNHRDKIRELLKNPILSLDKIAPELLQSIKDASEPELIATIRFLEKSIAEKQGNLQQAQTNLESSLADILKEELPDTP